jgi:hypothetical protein
MMKTELSSPCIPCSANILLFCCLLVQAPGQAQQPSSSDELFTGEDVLRIELSGKLNDLLKDRRNDVRYHFMTLSYTAGDSLIAIPIKVKTRGHFRKSRANCTYPPLLLNFSKGNPRNSIFNKQDKLKLVTPCQDDKYVVREYLVYQLYNLITPKSFQARLVKVVYTDSLKGKKSDPLFGILLEEEDQMAKRNNSIIVERKLVKPERTQSGDFLTMAVFEYLIGNTDWSVQYLQNVKLLANDSMGMASTVPYDFDHAGIVEAPYAKPADELLMTSTRERRYRGYCIPDMTRFNDVFAHFNHLKKEIYDIFANPLLEPGYVKSTTKFLDEFYETINNAKAAKAAFGYPCDKNGTGNVVIMGLDKN